MRNALGYSNVWEDAETLLAALQPVACARTLLSITSGGDNALAMLTLDPREVIAVDRNPVQSALLELRAAAFAEVDSHEHLLRFLGVSEAGDRLPTYRALRHRLTPTARAFWDGHPALVRDGVIHAGRFEHYLRFFARHVLPRLQSAAAIHQLFQLGDVSERERYYDTVWSTWRWRLAFRVLFGPLPVRLFARNITPPHQEARGLADRLLERTRTVLTSGSPASNPYLHYALFGNFSADCLPLYLRAERFPIIRERVDRLRIVTGRLDETQPTTPVAGFNLSDLLDHLSPAERPRMFQHVARIAAPGARLVLWNLLAPSMPRPLPGLVRHERFSDDLYRATMTLSYSGLSVYEFLPPDRQIAVLQTAADAAEPQAEQQGARSDQHCHGAERRAVPQPRT
jgi:S-adenosylmethionine-diacylglycerol 3-amino-3-carboxypropyl transferase